MNIWVTGSNGQLGSEIRELSGEYPFGFLFTDIEELDISKEEDVKRYAEDNNIDLIVNCAAYTAVDKAEEERELADLINHRAVGYLADAARNKGIPLIHISTDYVFDGKNYRPYREDDPVNPQSVYGLTKLKGEEAFKASGASGIIIRTSWVYSSYGHNFVKTMLRLKDRETLRVVFDQVGTPTYAKDLAKAILEIIDRDFKKINSKRTEIYHYSNEGVASWYDFAKAIFEIENVDIKVEPILSEEYPTPAKRPHYSVLDKSKIKKEFNLNIPHWKEALKRMLKRLNDG